MSSPYSLDEIKVLADALAEDGYTSGDLVRIRSKGRLKAFKSVVQGRSKIELVGISYAPLPQIISDGVAGVELVRKMELFGCAVDTTARILIKCEEYKSTSGITYHPVVFFGKDFPDDSRTFEVVREAAQEIGLVTPPPELFGLLSVSVSEEEMRGLGLRGMFVMHDALDGVVFGFRSESNGRRWIQCMSDMPNNVHPPEKGFVFLAPEQKKG